MRYLIPATYLHEAFIKALRGGKYYRRVPTGNPKRPWRYYYTKADYERAHPDVEQTQHISGFRAKRARAAAAFRKKMKAAIAKGASVKNALGEKVPAGKAVRLWVQGEDFGLPASTTDAHVVHVAGTNEFDEPIRVYSKERTQLHEELVAKATKGVSRTPPSETPLAIVMMGGGGAGKGTLIKSVVHNHADFVHVDPDDIKGDLPEYQQAMQLTTVNGTPVTAKDAAWMAHEESGDIAEKVLAQGLANRQSLIVDGTGKNAVKHAQKIERLKAAGYRVKLYYAHTDMNEAVRRAAERADRSGRFVPIPVLEDAHTRIPGNFEFVARHADDFTLFQSEKPPKTLWSGGIGKRDILHEEKAVEAFKALGRRLHKERGIEIPPPPDTAAKSVDVAIARWSRLLKGETMEKKKQKRSSDDERLQKPPAITDEELMRRIADNWHLYVDADENSTEGWDGGGFD